MTTTLQRLLKYPHQAVFDLSAAPNVAFRLRHPAGATWTVADEVMVVKVGSQTLTFDLASYTVATLAQSLSDAGFDVQTVSGALANLSARVLLEGVGNELQSNGDQVQAFTSLLWAMYSGYAVEVRKAEEQVEEALSQMVISQAEGEWLDLWGALYAVSRKIGEVDAAYAPRIPREAFRVRVNARAIELAIRDETGSDVRIEEPWQNIFRLDESVLSGPDKFYDGAHVGYHLIKPTTTQYVDWKQVLPIIDRNRAAGITVLDPENKFGSTVDGTDHQMSAALRRDHEQYERYEDRALLDYSTIEEVSILNHSARFRRLVNHSSQAIIGTQTWGNFPWIDETWGAVNYFVDGVHTRDYRVYYSTIAYAGQYWVANKTWVTADSTWADFNAIIGSAHRQS